MTRAIYRIIAKAANWNCTVHLDEAAKAEMIYPPPDFSSFFLFSFRLFDTPFLGVIVGEASKNSIRVTGIWRKSLFLM